MNVPERREIDSKCLMSIVYGLFETRRTRGDDLTFTMLGKPNNKVMDILQELELLTARPETLVC